LENIDDIIKKFPSTSLKEMDKVKLMSRIDTKFIFNINKLVPLLNRAENNYKVLVIDNKSDFLYKSLYFDTVDLSMYIKHHNGKQNRYKIRTRDYIQSEKSFVEIKFKTNKGRTIKTRILKSYSEPGFNENEKNFIKEKSPFEFNQLHPRLLTSFLRITLVHKTDNERITIDRGLKFVNPENNKQIELPFLSIAEVKQERSASASDFIKYLREEKIFPSGMSKYCTGTMLLNDTIKHNRFKERLLNINKINNGN